MRVCVVCHDASLTGAPRIGFDIAAHLARTHEVSLLAKKKGPLIDFPWYEHLRPSYRVLNTSHEVCDQTYRQRVVHAERILAELKPDLLYVNSVSAGEWCEAGKRSGVAVVLHTHETRDSLPSLLSSACTPRVLRFADLLVGASRTALEDLQELTSTSVAKTLDIGIFVDGDVVRAGAEQAVPPPVNERGEALPASSDRLAVAMCGLAQPRKGADIFLAVAERLQQYDFVWVGPWVPAETDLNDKTYERFQSLRLRNFYFTGITENPYAHLRRADAFLLTSREDPNPLVVAEALLLGRKVVAFTGTGASAALLARLGYALNGPPRVERIVAMLPRVLAGEVGRWHETVAERAPPFVESAAKLDGLQEALELFYAQWTAQWTAGDDAEAPNGGAV